MTQLEALVAGERGWPPSPSSATRKSLTSAASSTGSLRCPSSPSSPPASLERGAQGLSQWLAARFPWATPGRVLQALAVLVGTLGAHRHGADLPVRHLRLLGARRRAAGRGLAGHAAPVLGQQPHRRLAVAQRQRAGQASGCTSTRITEGRSPTTSATACCAATSGSSQSPFEADLVAYQYHQEFREAEANTWQAFGTTQPVYGLYLDETPQVIVYRRPDRSS